MGSGLNGQRFAFHGYLPTNSDKRIKAIKQLEVRSLRNDETEFFIETPYRNAALFQALISVCRDTTLLCIASGLMEATSELHTTRIVEWRTRGWQAPKRPTVFLRLCHF